MNREIKFRAWQVHHKEMYQPFDGYIEFPSVVVGFDDGDLRLEGDDVILMQYTGLKDKNSKEIYEGDILRWKYEGDEYIKQVEWKGFCFQPFNGQEWSPIKEECEVIGNIWENPELLNS